MATMVARMLELADRLAQDGRRSSALRRRAVSTAYYAVFHALAKTCADSLFASDAARDRSSQEYIRVYRGLEHGVLKNAFAQDHSPLKSQENFRRLGQLIVPLRSARFRADYLPPIRHVFSSREGIDLVTQAKKAVAELERLDDNDRRVLGAWLLFKNPPQ